MVYVDTMSDPDDGTVEIRLREVPVRLHRYFKMTAVGRNVSLNSLLIDALADWANWEIEASKKRPASDADAIRDALGKGLADVARKRGRK